MIYYIVPFILFLDRNKHPKLIDAMNGYMCLICLFAGIIVCIYTDMVMSNLIFINIQTLVHHGTQVIIGILIYVWNRKNISIKTVYRSLIVFVITAVIAIGINLSFYPNFINMFFINPTIITNLPLGNIVQENVGYPVYLILYLAAVSLLTFLTFFIETSIYQATLKKKIIN